MNKKISEKIWRNIEKWIYKEYPFLLITIGSMFFGYYLSVPTNFYKIFSLILFLCIATFGGSAIEKRLNKKWR